MVYRVQEQRETAIRVLFTFLRTKLKARKAEALNRIQTARPQPPRNLDLCMRLQRILD